MPFVDRQEIDAPYAVGDCLETRAAALVNPVSGLANDFLNVYNEILMLIELLPTMPDLIDDVRAWRPASYRAYFMQSQLPGRQEAIEAYNALEPRFRAVFEDHVERLAGDCLAFVDRVDYAARRQASEALELECARATARIRRQLDGLAQLVVFGRRNQGADMQAMVSRVFSAA